MNITVKNIKTMPTLDFDALICKVYVDNKMVGIYHDEGNGGEPNFQIHPYNEKNKEIVKQIEEYAKNLPKVDLNADNTYGDGKPHLFQPDFNWVIEQAITTALKERDSKKFKDHCNRGVVYGTDEIHYNVVYWKKFDLRAMRLMPRGTDAVQAAIDKVKQDGKKILNAKYLKSLGWKV